MLVDYMLRELLTIQYNISRGSRYYSYIKG